MQVIIMDWTNKGFKSFKEIRNITRMIFWLASSRRKLVIFEQPNLVIYFQQQPRRRKDPWNQKMNQDFYNF